MNTKLQITLITSALASLLGACGSSPTAKDLENFCRVVSEVDRESSLSNEQKLAKIEARKSEYVLHPKDTADLFAGLPSLRGEPRYNRVLDASKKDGKAGWTCNIYKRITIAADIELRAAEDKAAKARAAEAEKAKQVELVSTKPKKGKSRN